MKTSLLALMLVAAVSTASGQGTVNFSAGAAANTRVSTNTVNGGLPTGLTGPASSGYTYYYALFVADSTVTSAGAPYNKLLDPTLTPGWSLASWASGNPVGLSGGIYATNTVAGRFSGNPTTDDVFVSGRANGSSASFMVVGWSTQVAGADWTSAKAWIDFVMVSGYTPIDGVEGWAGSSGVATSVQLGTPGSIAPGGMFGNNPGQVLGFVLQNVHSIPEPGTVALLLLGVTTLLIFSQRKRQVQEP